MSNGLLFVFMGSPDRTGLGRNAWLDAARQALVEDGVGGVKINKLAKRLGVTRGGFYWHFESADHLLNELLAYWSNASTAPFERILTSHARDGMKEFYALLHLWVNESEYDPKWDAAIRDWARVSSTVVTAVQAVDEKRIEIIERIFLDLGYEGQEVQVRARVTYYHQVGYYALGVRESRERRLEQMAHYAKVLTGLP